MAGWLVAEFLRNLRRSAALGEAGEQPDADLLRRFVAGHDEAAFTALVQRHGPMVLGVCRQLLLNPHDVEDAFQAVFLVLVHHAAGLRRPHLLGNWLYGVAYRVAVRARAYAGRRRQRERQGVEVMAAEAERAEVGPEERSALHEELIRLPEKYRAPVVLCYLEGKTHAEAAGLLGWPVGTVKGRLARARDRLRARLTRRHVALSTSGLAAALSSATAPAAVPAGLAAATVKTALLAAAGHAAAVELGSAHVAALTRGALRSMSLTRFTLVCTVALGLLAAAGAGLLAYRTLAADDAPPGQESRPEFAAGPQEKPDPDAERKAEVAYRQRSATNVKQLAFAMHAYEELNGRLPPAALYSKDGKPLLSWRVLLLPYLDEGDLFREFKLEEPWDSEHNKKLLKKMPKVYGPVRPKGEEPGATFYQVLNGRGTIFEGKRSAQLMTITDGTSNTLLLAEAGEAVPWTKPADLPYDDKKPLPKFGGLFKEGFHIALADGSVFFGKKDPDETTLRRVITRGDGHVVDTGKLLADK